MSLKPSGQCHCGALIYSGADPHDPTRYIFQHGENPEHVRVLTRDGLDDILAALAQIDPHMSAIEALDHTTIAVLGPWLSAIHPDQPDLGEPLLIELSFEADDDLDPERHQP